METNGVGLRAVLERNRLQQKHVAEALDVSRMSVWQWVNGRAFPSGENLLRLLAYLQQFEPSLQAEDLRPAAEPAIVMAPESSDPSGEVA